MKKNFFDNLYKLLKICICAFVLFNMCKSCANAKTITGVEIANFILNGYGKYNNDIVEDEKIVNVQARMSNWEVIANSLNEHEGNYFLGYSKELKQAFFAYFYGPTNSMSSDNAFRIYNYSNLQSGYYFGKDNTSNTMIVIYYNVGDDTLNTYTWTNQNPTTTTTIPYTRLNDSFTTVDNRFFYTDRKVRFNYWGSYFNAGTYSPNQSIFEENFISSIKWELDPFTSNVISIDGWTNTFNTTYITPFKTKFADLIDSVYCGQINMSMYAYNGSEWLKVVERQLFNIDNNFIEDVFTTTNVNNSLKSSITVGSQGLTGNVIVLITAIPGDYYNLDPITGYYYITDSKTIITNGVLDTTATFSGDNDYTNNVNDAINNDQSNKDSENLQSINDWLTSSGEPNIGLDSLPTYEMNDVTLNFFDYLLDRISTLFLTDEPTNLVVNIPYLMSNEYTIYSDFFILGGVLKLFLNAFFIIWLIVPKLNDVHELIKVIQMGYTDAFINYFAYGISINDLL